MATLTLNCPHCSAKSMAFEMDGVSALVTHGTHQAQIFYALMTCNGCGRSVLAELNHPQYQNSDAPQRVKGDLRQAQFAVAKYWPQPVKTDAPEFTPENIARFFVQAASALSRGEWDSAGMMARKVLDAATFNIDPGLNRDTKLYLRIDKLAAEHKITPALQEWAHAIRIDGNDAAHEPEEFSEPAAKQICEFARTFLEYAFTMPGKLAARKATPESSGSEASKPVAHSGKPVGVVAGNPRR